MHRLNVWGRTAAYCFAALLLSGGPASAANFDVGNEAQLRSAIATAGNGDTITFTANIALTADLPAVQKDVTILGNGNALSGNNQFRGLLVGAWTPGTGAQVPVSVAIQDLTITDTRATGGSGGAGAAGGGGGGGAGLGGAIFVANRANVTVSNVILNGNTAVGGNGGTGGVSPMGASGGGGGMGGNGGNANPIGAGGGGGGLGAGASGGNGGNNDGQSGIATGAAGGGNGPGGGTGGASGGGGGGGSGNGAGGGGVNGGNGQGGPNAGGNGGFGGGGGVGTTSSGNGGFGGGGGGSRTGTAGGGGFGGGGGSSISGTSGTGGFGGGNGGATGGGGGMGAGGAIFVQAGGSLVLAGSLTVGGNTVDPGSAAGNGTDGSAFGSGLFLQGNGEVVFAPGAGQTQTVSDVIADRAGSGGGMGNYGLVKVGVGTTVLAGDNTYTGGTTIAAGALSIASDANLGAASGLLTLAGGTLNTTADATTARATTLDTDGGTFETNAGTTLIHTGVIGGTGSLAKTGDGTLTLSGTNSYTGGTSVNAGTLELGVDGGTTGRIAGAVTVAGTFNLINADTSGITGITTNDGGFTNFFGATTAGSATIVTNDGGQTSFIANSSAGSASIAVTGHNGYTFFQDSSTAAAATIGVSDGGTVQFLQNAVAGSANITADNGGVTFYDASSAAVSTISAINNGALAFANTATAGTALITVSSGGGLTFYDDSTAASATLIVNDGSGIGFQNASTAGTSTITANDGGRIDFYDTSSGGTARFIASAGGVFDISSLTSAGTTAGSIEGAGRFQLGNKQLTVGSNDLSTEVSGVISGSGGSLVKVGTGTLILTGANTYSGGTTVSAGILQGNSTSLRGAILNNASVVFDQASTGTYSGAMSGSGSLTKQGAGTLILTGANTYSGGTTVTAGTLQGDATSLQGSIVNNAAVVFNQTTAGTYAGVMSGTGSLTKLGAGTLILSGANTYSGGTTVTAGILQGSTTSLQGNIVNNATVAFNQTTTGTYAGVMSGTGSLTKLGAGTLILAGAHTYSGGTTVSAGTLQGTTTSLQGNIVNNSAVTFDQAGSGTYAGAISGTGSATVQGGGAVTFTGANAYSGGTNVLAGTLIGDALSLQGNILNNAAVIFDQAGTGTYAGTMSGSGAMTLRGGGTLALTGASTYSGGTTVDASTLVVNGSIVGTLTLNHGGELKGTGNVGTVVANGGILAPGNSIGTLTVNGNLTQNGTTYEVEANAAGQSDRINVTGAATIQGNSIVQVLAQPGTYARNTTYTILSANGGVTGTYGGVTSNFAFLLPRLSYNGTSVLLTLLQTEIAFASGAQTPNQNSVGQALDRSNLSASGDFNDVLNAIAGLSTQQGPAALDAISGQPYANFGTLNVQNNILFLNTFSQQLAGFRGGSAAGQRLALAEACEVGSCDTRGPWSAWGSAIGGLGSVQGNGNAGTFTYNLGGFAAGIDYRISPGVLIGLGAGYTSGSTWTNSFMGKGSSDSIGVLAYGSFAQSGFHADVLAGYAYSTNRMQRWIMIPGLQARSANGSTGASQFLGQVEVGYKLGLFAPAAATLTPFARLQGATINQSGFSEWGSANSLNLSVAQQTTNTLRTTFGADIAGSIGLGDARTLDLELRLGWQHEFADTARLMTAAFAGAPSNGFAVYGATPLRDSAVIGFAARTAVAEATQIYLRYSGELGSGADNHTLNVGLRMTW